MEDTYKQGAGAIPGAVRHSPKRAQEPRSSAIPRLGVITLGQGGSPRTNNSGRAARYYYVVSAVSHVDFFYFSIFGFWYTGYGIVFCMTSSYVTELRNVEWELYLLYTEGLADVKPQLEAQLWADVDRLEALIELES